MSAAPPPEPTTAASAGIPVHLTTFVGRTRELDAVRELLGRARLLTLTGAGGSGKTRLAAEAGLRAPPAFARVAWVELAPLADATLLVPQVAAALHVPERAGVPPLTLLVDAVGAERVLLVLDNCEHLVGACAELAEVLLRACPGLTILATSREALGIAGETAWLAPPLAGAEAVALFVERARAALPAFALTPANAGAVDEICRRLDGIPLAIELAAARVRVLPPEQIAHRLDDAFRLLTTGSRTALPRHRTLRATMEWSHALLGAREQVLLRRLAVFAGGFSLEVAEAVCAGGALDAEDILDGVAALVDRSLVVMEPGDGVARYRLLETVRQYGLERLAEAGEREALARRHAEHFLAVIEAAAPDLVAGSRVPGLFARLAADHDNLRAASAWSTADGARAELALRFVGALFWFWYGTGQFREARQLADRALALDDATVDPLHLGRARAASAATALAQGDYRRACGDFEAALPLLRHGDDRTTTGVALAMLGAARLFGGDVAGAVAVLDEALAFTRDAPPDDLAAMFARSYRGNAAHAQGDLDLACRLLAHNVRFGRDHAHPVTLAHSLAMLARSELARGRVDEARALAAESLEREVALDDGWGLGLALEAIATLAAARGRHEDAVRLLAGTDAHRERIAVSLSHTTPEERARMAAALHAALGERFARVHAEGRALSTAETVSLARAEAARQEAERRVPPAAVDAARPAAVEPPAVPGRLRVLALGPLQVSVGGEPVPASAWGAARPRELLVYLLLHPEGRTREQAGVAFWPDASAAQLRNNFHVTLHRLRRALGAAGGAEWVVLDGDRYRLNADLVEAFDAADFERDVAAARRALLRREDGAADALAAALAGYGGDLLDGERVGDWHLESRERLRRLCVEGWVSLGTARAAAGRHADAAEAFREALARDELHEAALRGLLGCHAALGERSQGLRTFRQFAERLRAELGTTPAAETARAAARLQQAG